MSEKQKTRVKLSIIVPVYNVEDYLKECIDSILAQTYLNYELILVDDGATDSSSLICDTYAEKNSCIRVVHQENKGLSEARNSGLIVAEGEYVIFVDSDDFIGETDLFKKINEKITETKSEVILFSYKKYFEESGRMVPACAAPIEKKLGTLCKAECFSFLVEQQWYITSAWCKAVRRDLLWEKELWFTKGVYSEDMDWCARLAVYAQSFSIVDSKAYIYRQRKGSITKTISEKNILDIEKNIQKSMELLAAETEEGWKKAYLSYIAIHMDIYCISLSLLDKEARKKHAVFVEEYGYLLSYGKSRRTKLIKNVLFLIGESGTLKLLRILNQYIQWKNAR